MSGRSNGRKLKRLILGDVIEIPLSKRRFTYAQFVYYHKDPPCLGHLIRVLPGVFGNARMASRNWSRSKNCSQRF